MQYSLKKNCIINKSRDFEIIIRQGKKIFTKDFKIYVTDNERGISRLGVIVKKTVAKSAVERNRIKRLVRESFRLNRNRFKACKDMVIIAGCNCSDKKQQDVEKELILSWQKSGII